MNSSTTPLYLDNAATTQLDPRVLDAMLPWLSEHYGNPSSVHGFGRAARVAIERAREHVCAMIGALPAEIIFTSGGTESDNTAMTLGARSGETDTPKHIVTSPAEHHAVLQPLHNAQAGEVTFVDVDAEAVPIVQSVSAALQPTTGLVALMHVNNETGGMLDVEAIGDVLATHPCLFFSDLVQSAGKIPIDIHATRVDIASMSAHKIHGPKGIGALYVRRGIDIPSFIQGGGQERGRRGGTENLAGIVGYGEAARIAVLEMEERMQRWRMLKQQLILQIRDALPGILVNSGDRCLPNIVSVSLPAELYPVDGEMLLMDLDLHGCAVSAGSACTAGTVKASHVLLAAGLDEKTAQSTVRFSFGAFTDAATVEAGARLFTRVVQDMLDRSSERSHSRSAMP